MPVVVTDNEETAVYDDGERVDVSLCGDVTVYDGNGEVIAWFRRDQVTAAVRMDDRGPGRSRDVWQ